MHYLSHLAVGFLVISACTTAPKKILPKTPQDLTAQLRLACEAGSNVTEVSGSVIVAASEMKNGKNGQLPASVQANSSGQLKLETMHLLGGTLGRLEVSEGRYRYFHDDQTQPSREGSDSYQGIPIRWAPQLFLGSPPCPNQSQQETMQCVQLNDADPNLNRVECKLPTQENFIYTLSPTEKGHWISGLEWKLNESSETVTFQFENSEIETRAYQTWQVSSSAGKVKVRWRKRSPTLAH